MSLNLSILFLWFEEEFILKLNELPILERPSEKFQSRSWLSILCCCNQDSNFYCSPICHPTLYHTCTWIEPDAISFHRSTSSSQCSQRRFHSIAHPASLPDHRPHKKRRCFYWVPFHSWYCQILLLHFAKRVMDRPCQLWHQSECFWNPSLVRPPLFITSWYQ